MDLTTIDRLKEIYWTLSEVGWIGNPSADAMKDLADIIATHEPTLGPLGTPILESVREASGDCESIVAFGKAEAERFDIEAEQLHDRGAVASASRAWIQAATLRAFAAQVMSKAYPHNAEVNQ